MNGLTANCYPISNWPILPVDYAANGNLIGIARIAHKRAKSLNFQIGYLRPGDFWDIPLEKGGFACGRVVQIEMVQGKRNSVGFLAGLMDWFGEELPTEKSIAGKRIIAQGAVHIKTIPESKGKLRGHRSLVLDGLGPWLFRDAEYGGQIRQSQTTITSTCPAISNQNRCIK